MKGNDSGTIVLLLILFPVIGLCVAHGVADMIDLETQVNALSAEADSFGAGTVKAVDPRGRSAVLENPEGVQQQARFCEWDVPTVGEHWTLKVERVWCGPGRDVKGVLYLDERT